MPKPLIKLIAENFNIKLEANPEIKPNVKQNSSNGIVNFIIS